MLTISSDAFPPFSFSNLKQEIHPVINGEFRQTLNGDLRFFSSCDQQKFKTIITGHDLNTPLLHSLNIGMHVTIKSIQSIWHELQFESEFVLSNANAKETEQVNTLPNTLYTKVFIQREFDKNLIFICDDDGECYNFEISNASNKFIYDIFLSQETFMNDDKKLLSKRRFFLNYLPTFHAIITNFHVKTSEDLNENVWTLTAQEV